MDLFFKNKEELDKDVKVWGSVGYSNREMMEFRILRGGRRTKNRITTLGFSRTNFGLFTDQL